LKSTKKKKKKIDIVWFDIFSLFEKYKKEKEKEKNRYCLVPRYIFTV